MRIFKGVLLSMMLVCSAVAQDNRDVFVVVDPAKKPNVLELVKPANDLMSKAQEAYVGDDSKKAISLFREALAVLAKVEQTYVEFIPTPEFAPVKFRKAICETEIERILLEEAQASSRTIAVTDTREIEQLRAERIRAATTNRVIEVTRKLHVKKSGAEADPEAVAEGLQKPEQPPLPEKPIKIKEELEWAKDMLLVARFAEADGALVKVLKVEPENKEARLLMALSKVEQDKAADALIVLTDLLEDAPADEAILLLTAAAHLSTGAYVKSMELLDKAMKTNPQRPDAYYNMAWLLLDMRSDSTAEAELYYRQSVKLGLARQRDIEKRLGIKP